MKKHDVLTGCKTLHPPGRVRVHAADLVAGGLRDGALEHPGARQGRGLKALIDDDPKHPREVRKPRTSKGFPWIWFDA